MEEELVIFGNQFLVKKINELDIQIDKYKKASKREQIFN